MKVFVFDYFKFSSHSIVLDAILHHGRVFILHGSGTYVEATPTSTFVTVNRRPDDKAATTYFISINVCVMMEDDMLKLNQVIAISTSFLAGLIACSFFPAVP